MPDYDSVLFAPPAPVAQVILRHPETGNMVENVPMLLDTGADATLIPLYVATQLDLTTDPERTYELTGFDGSTGSFQVVQAHLLFQRRTFRGRFLLIEQEWGLIGRDVLNHLSVGFNGPNLSWTVAV